MFYNFRLLPVFILLFVGFAATFRGLEIVKVGTFEVPFGTHERIDGPTAVRTGYAMIAVGIACLLLLISALF
jgi:hypothetical protein